MHQSQVHPNSQLPRCQTPEVIWTTLEFDLPPSDVQGSGEAMGSPLLWQPIHILREAIADRLH